MAMAVDTPVREGVEGVERCGSMTGSRKIAEWSNLSNSIADHPLGVHCA